MKVDNILISNSIKKYRALNDLKQFEAANLLGISTKTYNNIENNPIKYSIEELKKVADLYKCNVYDFFSLSNITESDN